MDADRGPEVSSEAAQSVRQAGVVTDRSVADPEIRVDTDQFEPLADSLPVPTMKTKQSVASI
jgi:hypothetical protein